jgi:GAF domain-containing protein
MAGQDGLANIEQPAPAQQQLTWLTSLERQLLIGWYGLTGWLFAPGWFTRFLRLGLSFSLLAYPFWKLGWTHGVTGTIAWAIVAVLKIRGDLAPHHLELVKKKRVERQFLHYAVVEKLQRLLLSPDLIGQERINQYRTEVLQLVAAYVRSHRSDERGTMVFANLLAEQDGVWKVLARDQRHRFDSPVIPKEHSLAWQAFTAGESKVTGDVYREYPNSPPGRPYRSILAIPVFMGEKPVGVVTIDSSRKYHFDNDRLNLVHDLNPFVSLLGWTLVAPGAGRAPQQENGQGRKLKKPTRKRRP